MFISNVAITQLQDPWFDLWAQVTLSVEFCMFSRYLCGFSLGSLVFSHFQKHTRYIGYAKLLIGVHGTLLWTGIPLSMYSCLVPNVPRIGFRIQCDPDKDETFTTILMQHFGCFLSACICKIKRNNLSSLSNVTDPVSIAYTLWEALEGKELSWNIPALYGVEEDLGGRTYFDLSCHWL